MFLRKRFIQAHFSNLLLIVLPLFYYFNIFPKISLRIIYFKLTRHDVVDVFSFPSAENIDRPHHNESYHSSSKTL